MIILDTPKLSKIHFSVVRSFQGTPFTKDTLHVFRWLTEWPNKWLEPQLECRLLKYPTLHVKEKLLAVYDEADEHEGTDWWWRSWWSIPRSARSSSIWSRRSCCFPPLHLVVSLVSENNVTKLENSWPCIGFPRHTNGCNPFSFRVTNMLEHLIIPFLGILIKTVCKQYCFSETSVG